MSVILVDRVERVFSNEAVDESSPCEKEGAPLATVFLWDWSLACKSDKPSRARWPFCKVKSARRGVAVCCVGVLGKEKLRESLCDDLLES